MFDKYIYNFLHWVMGWSGQLSSWAWRGHVKILKKKQQEEHDKLIKDKENAEYLKMLVRSTYEKDRER